MRNNKGVNLLSLIIMIIVMIIIAAIAMNVGLDSFDKAQEAKARTERDELVKAVSARFGDFQRNETASPLLGAEIAMDPSLSGDALVEDTLSKLMTSFRAEGRLVTDDERKNHTLERQMKSFLNQNIDIMHYSRVLSYRDLLNLDMDNVTSNSKYLVNYYTASVVGPIQ